MTGATRPDEGAAMAGEAEAPRPLTIGLTGPIGCGKSTVAGWLSERGAVAIDADEVARDVTGPGEPAVAAIHERFGDAVMASDGGLDRAALARIVFADSVALGDLEAIVHPAVRVRLLARLADARRSGAPVVVIEAIKLVEGGLAALCDEVWVVDCSPAVQRARLRDRGTTAEDAERRIAAQGDDLAERLALGATRVVRTDGPPADARSCVHATLDEAIAAHGRPAAGS